MDTKKTIQALVDKISAMNYGDTISHMDIERLTGFSRHSSKYGSVISRAKRQLQEEGKMIVSVWNVGYRVLEPDEYSNQANLALVYIRNGQGLVFPVKNLDHAVQIADAIADSDLLNDDVDYNMFDVCEYHSGKIGDSWESDDGGGFEEYWDAWRHRV